MSSYHVNFMKAVITKPLHVLRKDYDTAKHGRKSSTLTPDIPNVVIDGIVDEDFVLDPLAGRKKVIHRIFAKSIEAPDYIDVGWILNDDVDICMLCRQSPFGMFSYKHHCKACGNIFCSECAQSTAPIKELRGLGAFRVCNLCFYGQDTVEVTPNRPRPKINVTQMVKAPEESAEEKLRKLKMQQQEEFQRAALDRMRPSVAGNAKGSINVNNNSPQTSGKSLDGSGRMNNRNASMITNNTNNIETNSNNNNNNSLKNNNSSNSARSNQQITAEIACQLLDTDVEVEERRRRMQYFGELKLITPIPGFVVKSKRSSTTKIFVNVCGSPAVPLKNEPSSSRIDSNKKLYMLVSTPVEHQNEKDGSYCVLYDIVVHPDELTMCALDATGTARARLNNQAMQLIAAAYKEDVAMAPKVLQITANYKGRDDSNNNNNINGNNSTNNGSNSLVRPILVPAADTFVAVPQIPAVPPPLTPNNAQTSQKDTDSMLRRTRTLSLDDTFNNHSNSLTGSSGTSNSNNSANYRQSVVQLRGSTILASVGDSAALGVDRTLKAMILPREDVNRLFGKNFNFILDAMKNHEVNLKDVLLYPEPGFVISVLRQRPARRMYVNVTHHPAVGFVSQLFASVSTNSETDNNANSNPNSNSSGSSGSNKRRSYVYTLPTNSRGEAPAIPKPLPHIIGQVSEDIDDPYSTNTNSSNNNNNNNENTNNNNNNKVTVVDIVVPSAVFFAALQDHTGDLREQLAKEVLVRLSALHIRLSPDFQLLSQPLYLQTNALYQQQDALIEVVPPVLNLTEAEKTLYSAAFIGKVFKQGHGVKTWKERLTFVAENKLQYFDLRMNFKGEFNVEDCALHFVDHTNSSTIASNTNANTNTSSLSGRSSLLSLDNNNTRTSSSDNNNNSNNNNNQIVQQTNKSLGIPSGGFGFSMVNYASGGQFLHCYVPSEYMRDLYQLVLQARNAHIASLKTLIQIPDMKTGWLLKQGHLVRNWRRRFFVLNYGVLAYYDQDNVASRKGTVEAPKGKINLKQAKVVVVVTDEQGGGGRVTEAQERVSITDAQGGVLVVQMQTKDEKKEWFDSLRKHVLYANEYND